MTKLIGLVVLFTGSLLAVDCNSLVSNDAGVALDTTALIRAANDVAGKGAEPHVLIETLRPGETLDTKVAQGVAACPAWQAPDGKTKSTLIVFAVAPIARKSGIFYGSAWHHALDDSWNRIKTDYMNPRFRDGDWAGGLAAAAEQTAKRISASEDEAVHGPTTVNQATDLSGLWRFLLWLLGIVVVGAGATAVFIVLRQKREDDAEVQAAQADAIAARNKATDALNDARRKVPIYAAAGGKNAVSVQAWLATAMERYQTLTNSVSNDPEQKGFTADGYRQLSKQYDGVFSALDKIESLLADKPEDKPKPAAPAPSIPINDFRSSTRGKRYRRSEAPTQPAPTYAPTAAATPIIVNNTSSNDGFVEGFVLGDVLADRHEPAPSYTPTYSAPAPSYTPTPEPERYGGGSSSFETQASNDNDGGSQTFDASTDTPDISGGSDSF